MLHKLSKPFSRSTNVSSVAVLPESDRLPLTYFVGQLQRSLERNTSTLCLSREGVQASIGKSAFDNVSAYRLSNWLSQQDDVNRMVLYRCDFHLTHWTHRCVRQADCVPMVAVADQDLSVGELERQLEMLLRKSSSCSIKKAVRVHATGCTG